MKQKLSLLSVFALLILTACAAQATPTPIELVEPVIVDTPTPKPGCSAIDIAPTSAPSTARDAYFPPANAGDFSIGPADAPVTLVEYCEFQSEGCLNMALVVGQLMRDRDDLRFVFRPLPLIGILDKSEQAVLAALAADEQGKFWEVYDLLFIKQAEWKSLKPEAFNAWLVRESAALEVDVEKLEAAMKAEETAAKLQRMYESAKELSIPAVPLILINGNPQPSYLLDYRNMSDTVGLTALGQKQFSQCPPFDIDPQKQYIATLRTEKGDVVIQLFADKAPLAVNSFVFLARQGWYDGVTFYSVGLEGSDPTAKAGDPSGMGRGNAGYFFDNETNNLKFDKPGMVAMDNDGLNTNSSRFFITFAPAPHLDGAHTIFGQVMSGLDAAEQLTPGDKILGVEIEEK
jgi:cyclophilin family peptidyl-prolyl cis-trans isomerase/protein-disulfide isomerase